MIRVRYADLNAHIIYALLQTISTFLAVARGRQIPLVCVRTYAYTCIVTVPPFAIKLQGIQRQSNLAICTAHRTATNLAVLLADADRAAMATIAVGAAAGPLLMLSLFSLDGASAYRIAPIPALSESLRTTRSQQLVLPKQEGGLLQQPASNTAGDFSMASQRCGWATQHGPSSGMHHVRARVSLSATATVSDEITKDAPLRVVIAGCGVGGALLAKVLAQKGVAVTVLERTEEFRRFGGPIQLASNALSVLRALDRSLFDRLMGYFTFTGVRTSGIVDGEGLVA
eukprot:6197297-Pleurochrysis_carterae.AAC.1